MLCDLIYSEAQKSVRGETRGCWEYVPEGENSCRVVAADFEIVFHLDPRVNVLSSDIRFYSANEAEPLDVHTLVKMFPESLSDYEDYGSQPVKRQIEIAIKAVDRVLNSILSGELSPRDFLYFFYGYTTAYTDRFAR